MKQKRGPNLTLNYTNEIHNILLKAAKAENKTLPEFIMKKVSKLNRALKNNDCAPCNDEDSQMKKYRMELPPHMEMTIQCLNKRFNMQPASWIKRFIVDAEVIKFFQEQESDK